MNNFNTIFKGTVSYNDILREAIILFGPTTNNGDILLAIVLRKALERIEKLERREKNEQKKSKRKSRRKTI